MPARLAAVFVVLVAAVSVSAASAAREQSQLVVNGKPTLRVWTLATPAARAQGVKGQALSTGQGLWFAWGRKTAAQFWMEGVEKPLILVWIGADHRVIALRRMAPCPHGGNSCPTYAPPEWFRWAVELLPGDLARSGLKAGAVVALRPLR
jgi:uncharacterized membrane protein (UPF0127 family)